jgi:hypothetical protein
MRDPRRQLVQGNFFTVTFPDFPSFDLQPHKIELIQAMGKHDILKIHYPDTITYMLDALTTGALVEVSWKNDKVSGNFKGYKYDSTYTSSVERKRRTTLTFLGASFVLKESGYNIWVNKTATEVIEEIALKFKLKPVVTPHPTRFGQQSMAGHSYWEKANELADIIGYGLQMQGTELHCHPVDIMIDKFLTTVPSLTILDYGAGPDTVHEARTLEYFEPKIGDFLENKRHRRTEKIVKSVDPYTAKVYGSSVSPSKTGEKLRKNVKEPLFSQIETRTVTASNSMTQEMAKAKAEKSRLSIMAKGGGQGDPRIAPWRTVLISGTENAANGLWVIETAHHTMFANYRYIVEFTCLTDGVDRQESGKRGLDTGTIPYRNVSYELTSATQGKPTYSTLSASSTIISEANTGFKISPRRWEAR